MISLFLVSKDRFSESICEKAGEDLKCCDVCWLKRSGFCKKICKRRYTLYVDFLDSRGENSQKHTIDYITRRGYQYRIIYRCVVFFKWELEICIYYPKSESNWLRLTFGRERALFPRLKMRRILRGYAENHDEYVENHDAYKEKLNVNI